VLLSEDRLNELLHSNYSQLVSLTKAGRINLGDPPLDAAHG